MSETTSIQPGRYRYYKGNEYTVIGTARHSETLEELVINIPAFKKHRVEWTTPDEPAVWLGVQDG